MLLTLVSNTARADSGVSIAKGMSRRSSSEGHSPGMVGIIKVLGGQGSYFSFSDKVI